MDRPHFVCLSWRTLVSHWGSLNNAAVNARTGFVHPAQTHSSLGVSWHSEVPHPTPQVRQAGSTETLECWSGQAVPEPSLRLWLARAFRKPGPGPGLDRTSWFSSRPENMKRWPSALAVRPGPVGGAGRPPVLGQPGLSSPGAGLGCHAGAQLGRLLAWPPPPACGACDGGKSGGALAPGLGWGWGRHSGKLSLNPELLSGAGGPGRETPPSAPQAGGDLGADAQGG